MAAITLFLAAGCASGVSNCRSNAKDTLRSTKRTIQSYDLIGSVVDIATLPLTATATCAKDIAVSPVYEAARLRTRTIKAERVTADDPRVSRAAMPITKADVPPPAEAPKPATAAASCDYKTDCVVASTLLVSPSRGAGDRIMISQVFQQYELTNNCGVPLECFVCGTKDGKVSRASGATCDDATHRKLESGETWIGNGTAENVDGMAMSCLVSTGTSNVACRTWPE